MTIPSAIHFQGTAVLAQQDSHQPVHHVLAVELLLDIVGHHSGKTEEKAAEGKHCARAGTPLALRVCQQPIAIDEQIIASLL